MGWRIRKSIKLGKGVRLNLSKSGVGFSAGLPGMRVSVGSDKKVRKTIGIPGTGIYKTQVVGKKKPKDQLLCPDCTKPVGKNANFCPNCGAKVK